MGDDVLSERVRDGFAAAAWAETYLEQLGERPRWGEYTGGRTPKRTDEWLARLAAQTGRAPSLCSRILDTLEAIRPDKASARTAAAVLDLGMGPRLFRELHPHQILRGIHDMSLPAMAELVIKHKGSRGKRGRLYEAEVQPPSPVLLTIAKNTAKLFGLDYEDVVYDTMKWYRCRAEYVAGDTGALQRWLEHLSANEDSYLESKVSE